MARTWARSTGSLGSKALTTARRIEVRGGRLLVETKDGKTTLGKDGHHANLAGEYLGACVWYEVLFGESVVGNKYVPPGLDPARVLPSR